MATDEVLPTKQRPKEIPKGDLVWLLLGINSGAFNAGLFFDSTVSAIVHHGLKSHLYVKPLAMGCISLCVAILLSALIFSRAKWIPERGY